MRGSVAIVMLGLVAASAGAQESLPLPAVDRNSIGDPVVKLRKPIEAFR